MFVKKRLSWYFVFLVCSFLFGSFALLKKVTRFMALTILKSLFLVGLSFGKNKVADE